MSKIRINELARELEVKPNVILELLPELGVSEKKTHSSSLDDEVALEVRRRLGGAVLENGAGRAPAVEQELPEVESMQPVSAEPAPAPQPGPKAEPAPVEAKKDMIEESPAPAPQPRVHPLRPPLASGMAAPATPSPSPASPVPAPQASAPTPAPPASARSTPIPARPVPAP